MDQAQAIRKFHRAARRRLETATFLVQKSRFYVDAIYLAGYAVECALKALILKRTAARKFKEVYDAISQGKKAHDYEYLKGILAKPPTRMTFPPEIQDAFRSVASWSTDLRYETTHVPYDDAESFVEAARTILAWVERQLS